MDFKKNGTAELRLSNGSQLVFSFDTAVAERVLFRSQELWPKLQVGPGQVVQDNMISFTYARDTRSCFLEYSQNLPLSTLLANWWGVGAWYGLEANQEDVSLTLLSQVLASVSAEERQELSVAVARSGAPPAYSRWIRSPLEAFDKNLEDAWCPDQVLSPEPWIEMMRESCPDGMIDAVLLERNGPPYRNTRHPSTRQVNLFLILEGGSIEDLVPSQFKDFQTVRSQGRADDILAQRYEKILDAYNQKPERFLNGPPKPKTLDRAVYINPPEKRAKCSLN